MVSLAAISGAAQTWTYSDCVEYAREHNISLQKSRLTELSSEYTLEESKAQWEPTLDFATTHSVSNYPWKEITKNSYNSSYGLKRRMDCMERRPTREHHQTKQTAHRINRLTTGQMMRTLETDLLQVYINILYAKESIGIYKEAAKVSLAQSERARELMEAGKISRVDYAQLNSQYEQDKYALVNAQSTYDSRLMELKQLLELGIETEIRLADVEWDAAQVLAALPPIAESYRMALDTDLRIKALEIEKSSSDLDIAIAKAGRMPKISLNAGVGTGYYAPGDAFGSSMKKGLNESLGLTLSIPIFDNKKTKTAVAQARVANLNAQLDINQRQTDIAQLVENWYIDTQSAQSRYSAAETQLESARLSDELTNERFNLGYVNTVELMTAHNSYIEARHTVLQAKYMAMLGQKMVEFYRNATVTLP